MLGTGHWNSGGGKLVEGMVLQYSCIKPCHYQYCKLQCLKIWGKNTTKQNKKVKQLLAIAFPSCDLVMCSEGMGNGPR